jgi:hypothetical protein
MKITHIEVNDFYEKYSLLDSKSGLLFSYTARSSAALMKEIQEILTRLRTNDDFCEELKVKFLRKLADVELTLKHELGVYSYKNSTTITKEFKLPKTNTEILDKIYGVRPVT